MDGTRLQRRLEALRRDRQAVARADEAGEADAEIRARLAAIVRAADSSERPEPVWRDLTPADPRSLAERLAAAVDGEAVETFAGWYVRRELRPVYLPIDRRRLAWLPGMPEAHAPLLCLDTETTGLGSAAGTIAFLVGLGWWQADRLRLVQLFLPDQSEERALLAALAAAVPSGGWLVTYNGRAFDWPLLETRFRMGRSAVPDLAGHLDLLPPMRRLVRHRLPDARLQTVERGLLRRVRPPDIPAWQIPSLYHSFLRGGPAGPIRVVARHNAEDVASLGRLLVHLSERYADDRAWRLAPSGDLLRLGRLLRSADRIDDALRCLEAAGASLEQGDAGAGLAAAEQARLLRRLGRMAEASLVWRRLAGAPGPLAALAWLELAKEHEHRRRDLLAACRATDEAARVLSRVRLESTSAAGLETAALAHRLSDDIARRRARLARRLAAAPRARAV